MQSPAIEVCNVTTAVELKFWSLIMLEYQERFGYGVLDSEAHKETVVEIRKSLNDVVIPRHLAFLEAFLSK